MSIVRTIIGAVVMVAGLLCSRVEAKDESTFIWISDLHFDPTATPELTDKLAEANVDKWSEILEASTPGRFSRFGEDTDWALLNSSFEAIRKTAPQAQFTVVTGDLLVHHFREKFEAAATKHDNERFRQFATKAIQFVASQLATIAPGKPVLVTLGNNDSECGDYELQPGGAFLKDASEGITKLLGPLADKASTDDWTALGSYSAPHPALKNYRVISVNSVYFSARYKDACSVSEGDHGKEEMEWLGRKLAEAKGRKEKVWLIYHVAPGIDGYASSHPRGGGPAATVPMWKPAYTDSFRKLLSQYRETVTISLAGHEHTDDFRLLDDSLVLLTPGLSPVVKQNPAFRVVTFRPDGVLSDAATYYLANLDAVSKGAAPDWKFEYSFAQAWGLQRLDFKNFLKLHDRIEKDPEARERWSTFYSVSHPENSITKQSFPSLFCATGNATRETYEACLQRSGRS